MADTVLIATVKIVASWLGANPIDASAVPDLIRDVHKSLVDQDADVILRQAPRLRATRSREPAVDIGRSVFADHLVCLEDGRTFKTLTRHLNEHKITPALYRAKWGLPENYPMMAPNYSKVRSRLSSRTRRGIFDPPG
jgi:predicted transcriptional regulator